MHYHKKYVDSDEIGDRDEHYLLLENDTNPSLDQALFLSPWHSLPLRPQDASPVDPDIFTGFIEITRGTTAKMEVTTDR